MNIFIVKGHRSNKTLFGIYGDIMKGYTLEDTAKSEKIKGDRTIYFNVIDSINYVKNTLSYFLRHILYYVCYKKFKIHENKFTVFRDRSKEDRESIDIEVIYRSLFEMGQGKIAHLLKLFENDLTKRLTIDW